jgi:tRNA A-37 threonylcarbamoyl transferase component Bud32
MGRVLWRCAFGAPSIAELWRASVALSDNLRLRLVIDTPELAGLPWELLYDETLGRFLALDGRTPVTRFTRLPVPAIPWPIDRPLRLHFTAAAPAEQYTKVHIAPQVVAREWQGIEQALAPLVKDGRVEAAGSLTGATRDGLLAALRRGVDIWHYLGHGEAGSLLFVDAAGRVVPVDAGELGQVLAGEGVRLAVLNTCQAGAGGGQAASVAGALLRAGIPAVVAMQSRISVDAALAFAGAFYDAIAVGLGVDRALTAGRKAIWAVGAGEWWIPALFMRTPEGRIWQEPAARAGAQITVHGDVIYATGPVATHGSAISTGSGTAIANTSGRSAFPAHVPSPTQPLAMPPAGDEAPRLPRLANGERFLGRFVIKGFIGRGGFSDTYIAWDRTKDMEVVVKRFSRGDDIEDYLLRYVARESKLSQRLRSHDIPGLIKTHEIIHSDNEVCLVQEPMAGASLHQRIEDKGIIVVGEAVETAIHLGETLEHLHQLRIAHCDVKPLNVIIRSPGQPVLIDLGAARFFDEALSGQEVVISVPYSPPECLTGRPVDGRTDQYALGMTLLHMLTGLPRRFNIDDTMPFVPDHVRIGRIPSPQTIRDHIQACLREIEPQTLRPVIARAVADRVEQRYATMTDFCQALREAVP